MEASFLFLQAVVVAQYHIVKSN